VYRDPSSLPALADTFVTASNHQCNSVGPAVELVQPLVCRTTTLLCKAKELVMGFTKSNFPPIDPEEFLRRPLMDRMKYLALWWVENGFGTPKVIHTIYVLKLLFFFILGGVVVATATSHLVFWDVASWWNQPVVYQKVILWTVLLEALNVAGSWGPLVGKFKPMTGGVRFWAQSGSDRGSGFRSPPVTDAPCSTWCSMCCCWPRSSSPWCHPGWSPRAWPPRCRTTPPAWSTRCC
jgi:hypothetical protein